MTGRLPPALTAVTSSEKSLNCTAISARDAVGVGTKAPDRTDSGWVLVQTDTDAAPAVADALTRLGGVTVERTVGAYDLVAHVDEGSVVGAERVVQAAAALPGVQLAVCCHATAHTQRHGHLHAPVHPAAHAPAARTPSVPAAGKASSKKSRQPSPAARRHALLG